MDFREVEIKKIVEIIKIEFVNFYKENDFIINSSDDSIIATYCNGVSLQLKPVLEQENALFLSIRGNIEVKYKIYLELKEQADNLKINLNSKINEYHLRLQFLEDKTEFEDENEFEFEIYESMKALLEDVLV